MPATEPEHHYALPFQQMLRHFMVERLLGQGGFGLTYLALDTKLDRHVAIKELLPSEFAVRGRDGRTVYPRSPADAGNFAWALRRFLEEGQTLARLHHPAILPIYDFFEENGTAYLITAYIQGENFEQRLQRRGRAEEAELRQFTLKVLDALQLVHSQSLQRDSKVGKVLLHRDIKTENILMDSARGNTPVLIDFGNARISSGEKTNSLTAVLTKGYAPFEQYTTNGKQGPWTDLYALGAVLFRAITGKPPEDSADRLDEDNVPRLAVNPPRGYSHEFLVTIDKALRMRREERWQTCQEWLDALGVHPPPPPPPLPGPGWLRRHWLMLAGLLVVAAVTGIVFMVLSGGDGSTKSDPTPSPTPTPVPSPARVIETTPKPVVTPATPTPRTPTPTPTPTLTPRTPTPSPALTAPSPSVTAPPFTTVHDPRQADAQHFSPFENDAKMLFVPVEIKAVPAKYGKVGVRPGRILFSVYPTREKDYDQVVNHKESSPGNPNADKPKVSVNWSEANRFCDLLSSTPEAHRLHLRYRLPEDYEWSYAVGGLDTEFDAQHLDLPPMAKNHAVADVYPFALQDKDKHRGITPVGQFARTTGGLYDMGGNVLQWCATLPNGSSTFTDPLKSYVVRGSSWKACVDPDKKKLFSSFRNQRDETAQEEDLGFRCVAEIVEAP